MVNVWKTSVSITSSFSSPSVLIKNQCFITERKKVESKRIFKKKSSLSFFKHIYLTFLPFRAKLYTKSCLSHVFTRRFYIRPVCVYCRCAHDCHIVMLLSSGTSSPLWISRTAALVQEERRVCVLSQKHVLVAKKWSLSQGGCLFKLKFEWWRCMLASCLRGASVFKHMWKQ